MKILLVDDHPLVLRALEQALPELDPSLSVLGAADRGDALRLLARHPECALILLDLALPGIRGVEFLVELRRHYPRVPVLMLSATHDRATIGTALAAGARGFVAKTASPRMLHDAVRTVLAGGEHVTRDVTRARPAAVAGMDSVTLGLTQRQSDVLQLLMLGKPNKLICRDLNLSEGTVKVHVSAILRALNVHSRAQAIAELTRRSLTMPAFDTSDTTDSADPPVACR